MVSSVLKLAGVALLVLAAAGWLSLMTWSAQDPSLTHATGRLTRNWLGPLGAILSDLLLQTLGFVAIFTFAGLAFCGAELLLRRRIAGLKLRLVVFPLALLVLAGAFSSLPAPASWPLNHSLGGMIGDAVFNLVAGILALINASRAGAVAGFLLFTTGMCMLSAGLGLTQGDWAILWQRSERPAGTIGRTVPATGLLAHMFAALSERARRARATAAAKSPQTATAAARSARTDDSDGANGALLTPSSSVRPTAAIFVPAAPISALGRSMGQPPATAEIADSDASPDAAFERSTEHGSASIAQRFAPAPQGAAQSGAGPGEGVSRKASDLLGGLLAYRPASAPAWRRPSLNLLKRPAAQRPGGEFTQPVLRGSARLLEDVLADFSVKGEIKDIKPGPVVTRFEFEPARGTKTARVIALAEDIARSMSAASARVAVVPGRNAIGIELPNVRRETVYLRDLLESEEWRNVEGQLPVVLGKGIGGETILADLSRMPHLLIAGTTGSGKSVGVNVLILSLLFRQSPEECRLLLIDPKMLELSAYNGIPHLLAPVITDPHRATAALTWVVGEMEERYKRMAQIGVRNIEMFNNRVRNARWRGESIGRTVQTGFDQRTGQALYEREQMPQDPLPLIVVVVDEFADLMVVAGKEIEAQVQRLAQMARAAGIHLVMATQRPSVDVVTGTIKANFPTRIAFKVASKIDSRTILNEQGAEQLLGQGDMLYSGAAGQCLRVHGPFVSDEEVERVTEALKAQFEPRFASDLVRLLEGAGAGALPTPSAATAAGDDDALFDRAVAIVHRDQKASTSYLQRRLSIGYNRAADLIERMESEGLVSAADAVGRRQILIDLQEPAKSSPDEDES